MFRFIRRRGILWPFGGAFSTFIIACGVTHLMDIWTIWHPDYWAAGGLKALCALASIATAAALLPFMPYSDALQKISELGSRHSELERQFARIVETTSDGVWILDAEARTTLANERISSMLGLTPAEINGRSLFDLMHGYSAHASNTPFCHEEERPSEQMFCLRHKDGSKVWAELHFSTTFDQKGNFAGAIATVVDVSERLRAQAALEENERRYRALAEAMPQMVWTAGADGNITYWNRNWEQYTGTTFNAPAEAVWRSVVHALDFERFFEHWERSLRTGQHTEAEYRLLRGADGAYRWHIGRLTAVFNEHGAIEQWVGSFTDIHDYKVAIETRGLLDLIGHIVLICTEDDATVYANPHWSHYTGGTSDSVFGFRWRNFIHPDDLTAFDKHKAERRELGLDALEYELRVRGQNGEYRWFLVRTALLPGAPVQPRRWLKTLTDIEELKRTQDALARDMEAAKKNEAILAELHEASVAATEAKSRFLATMSHEIRTPMNGIVGMAELLVLTQLDDEQTECARVIRDSSRSLLRVLNDILDYSKVEAGKLDLEVVDFDLQRQLDSVVNLLGSQFKAKNIALTHSYDTTLPADVKGDPGRLRQILFNLVGNALKFTPPGGRVAILVERASDGADGVVQTRFTVKDTGIGIHESALDRLFKPFSQADGSTTRRFGGTGLGLSISAELVALMGGRIGVQSQPGEGSSFWFSVPFAKASPGGAERQAPAYAQTDRAARPCQRAEHILVAEDNAVNLLVARKQFAKLGFSIEAVGNGWEAVAAAAGRRFDLIFMDCHMPELDGFEATAKIRAAETGGAPRTPIIAMTADARDDDRRLCLAAGMDDYISKPTSLENLQAVIERWLAVSAAPTAEPRLGDASA